MAAKGWMPHSWEAELAGCIWLPRILDKGRRILESERHGKDLMNGYLFGDNDLADAMLLKFLNITDMRIRELLQETDDDQVVAETLIRESGHSSQEVQAWNQSFQRKTAPFLAMQDADEGRRKPGLGTSLLGIFYNFVLMPPAYLTFRTAERLRCFRHR